MVIMEISSLILEQVAPSISTITHNVRTINSTKFMMDVCSVYISDKYKGFSKKGLTHRKQITLHIQQLAGFQ